VLKNSPIHARAAREPAGRSPSTAATGERPASASATSAAGGPQQSTGNGERDGTATVQVQDAAAVATERQLLLHLPAEHRRHGGGHEQPVRGRVDGCVDGCVVVGGVLADLGEQYVALVEPRIPEGVEHKDRPVHRPVPQADVEPVAAGQPAARQEEQFACRGQETAEGGGGELLVYLLIPAGYVDSGC
jgi:hypothetical protein